MEPVKVTSEAAAPAPKVYTSEKLTLLTEAFKTAWALMLTFTNPMEKAAKDAKLAVLKIEGEMKAEESAIIKAEAEAKLAEAKNERLKLVANLLSAHAAVLQAPKTVTADAKAKLQSDLDTATEIVQNELLQRFAGSKPAKAATDGEVKATTGRDSEQKAAILEMFISGKTHKDIEAAGYPRSTVWHTINNYKKANA